MLIFLMRCNGDLYFLLSLRFNYNKGWLEGNKHKLVNYMLNFRAFRVLIKRTITSTSRTLLATKLKAPVTAWALSF